MPDFTRAEISETTRDLSPYLTFLKRLAPGQTVAVPLERGETSRVVMRALNLAARQSGIRLARLTSERSAVRFRVLSSEKRAITMSDEQKRARVEKAMATRLRRRTEPGPAVDVGASPEVPVDETTGMDTAEQLDTTQIEAAEDPVETDVAHPGEALGEPVSEDPVTHELVPPEQQVREADAGAAPAGRSPRARRSRSAAGAAKVS